MRVRAVRAPISAGSDVMSVFRRPRAARLSVVVAGRHGLPARRAWVRALTFQAGEGAEPGRHRDDPIVGERTAGRLCVSPRRPCDPAATNLQRRERGPQIPDGVQHRSLEAGGRA